VLYQTGFSEFQAIGATTINSSRNILFRIAVNNNGDDYNPNTGVFTCRIPGFYWFSASLISVSATKSFSCSITVNSGIELLISSVNYGADAKFTVSGSGVIMLSKAETVQVGICDNPQNIDAGTFASSFSGFLIRPYP